MNGARRKAIGGYENAEASSTKARILETPGLSKRVDFVIDHVHTRSAFRTRDCI
ncbi:hypothetical protein F0726_02756 [Acidithiobacillus caldus]|nr:hypothetical protein F0726_02756 [Acidithiobacillus caldus]